MDATQIKKAWKAVNFHAKIAWRGFYRTVYGALVAGLVAMAIYGFVSVTTETGWTAVCDFIASCATLLVALSNMYLMGGRKKCAKNGG
jgi:FtsH-binding integral membrane protein